MRAAVLSPELYEELRAIARSIREQGRGARVIEPTELVHEAWAKISRGKHEFVDRQHFVAVAAQAMRQILIDQVRRQMAAKRGGDVSHTTLSSLADIEGEPVLLEVDAALTRLDQVDPKASEVFVIRAFGGLTLDETAEALDLSRRTIARKWRYARAFVARELNLETERQTDP